MFLITRRQTLAIMKKPVIIYRSTAWCFSISLPDILSSRILFSYAPSADTKCSPSCWNVQSGAEKSPSGAPSAPFLSLPVEVERPQLPVSYQQVSSLKHREKIKNANFIYHELNIWHFFVCLWYCVFNCRLIRFDGVGFSSVQGKWELSINHLIIYSSTCEIHSLFIHGISVFYTYCTLDQYTGHFNVELWSYES